VKAFVVDVNVAIVANGKSKQADVTCELACVRKLQQVTKNLVVIDAGDQIMSEYRRCLSMRGQPGVGDAFMLWIFQNQSTPERCERVSVTENPDRGFDEFPEDPSLSGFDPKDRKYVAVAIGSRYRPHILNAVDSDWRNDDESLKRHGVVVDQLCPQCLKER